MFIVYVYAYYLPLLIYNKHHFQTEKVSFM